jgi:hypothetical protein
MLKIDEKRFDILNTVTEMCCGSSVVVGGSAEYRRIV